MTDLISSLAAIAASEDGTCTLCDAMGRANAMAGRIQALWPGARLFGPAVTARPLGSDLTAVFAAVDSAQPGDVIVIDGSGANTAFWGENTTVAAIARRIAGVVIDGAARDVGAIRRLGLPLFATGSVPIAGTPAGRGEHGGVIQCGGVPVRPGDLIAGDENGVVVVPSERADSVLSAARALQERESEVKARLERGEPLSEALTAALKSYR